jgi:hypothetical protein
MQEKMSLFDVTGRNSPSNTKFFDDYGIKVEREKPLPPPLHIIL